MSGIDETTLTLGGAPRLAAAEAARPTLTLLAHPETARVGERVLLTRPVQSVSRLEPAFAPPGTTEGRPITDPFVSRQPLAVALREGGGVLLKVAANGPRVTVDGAPLTDALDLSAERVADGVVIELAGRVALLLHLFRPSPPAPALDLVGASEGIERVRHEVLQVADLDVPVLVRGETGSGKELVARAIHVASDRRDGPFVAVNMAAVPPTLAASELFGHEKGAFSGAVRRHDGHFVRADGGSLFLDEVGDTPLDVQAMLLRVLETSEVHPVGAPRTMPVDVRLVAATDADLEAATRDGRFRTPLLHRLAGFRIDVPPLRARRDDIGRLFFHFARLELEKLGGADRLDRDPASPWVPAGLVAALARYDWPGNVRQLRNVTRQLVIANRRADVLAWTDLVPRLLGGEPDAVPLPATGEWSVPQPAAPRRSYRRPGEVTEDELVAALRKHRWRLKPAAEALGVSRTALYALIENSARLRKATDLSAEDIRAAGARCADDPDEMAATLEVSRPALLMRMTQLGLR